MADLPPYPNSNGDTGVGEPTMSQTGLLCISPRKRRFQPCSRSKWDARN